MEHAPPSRVLVVDDESVVRNSIAMLLRAAGYEVSTAHDGFDALIDLRRAVPDAIISDLNMPRMSGFELLSVVRRRFPGIVVVAVSGAYDSDDCVPDGVIADAFYAKGRRDAGRLTKLLAGLLEAKATWAAAHHSQSAPVWIPRNGKDSKGIPFIVVTCTECLRSFPLSVQQEDLQEIQETPCLFCTTPVR